MHPMDRKKGREFRSQAVRMDQHPMRESLLTHYARALGFAYIAASAVTAGGVIFHEITKAPIEITLVTSAAAGLAVGIYAAKSPRLP